MITIGTRIKYLRLKHEMTMKQLGQQMGFSPASADVLEIAPEYLSIPVPSTPEEIKVIEFW